MSARRQRTDPRTVAREIPGLFDILFPQLVPGLVVHLNREIQPLWRLKPLPSELLEQSTLNHAMLFEIAYVRAERFLLEQSAEWKECIELAVKRQRRYFDATVPDKITDIDCKIADWVGKNLFLSLKNTEEHHQAQIYLSPAIRGFGWIANGQGDYAVNHTLIEAKCTAKRFSSADYRQVLIYWLLSYASAVEGQTEEWKSFILLNPRLCLRVELNFDDVIPLVAADRSKVEILELFNSTVGDYLKTDH